MRIVRVGIKRVVSQKKYHADALSRKMFKDAGVELLVIDDTLEQYSKQ
jgi:dCMP deaminase